MPDAVFKDLCIDVGDLSVAVPFYAGLLGLRGSPEATRLDGDRPEQTVWLNVVPDPKTVKNRVHLDVHVTGLDEVRALGATDVQAFARWTMLADLEGQEFCAFVVERPAPFRLFEVCVDAADPEPLARWWADRLGAVVDHVVPDPWWTLGGGDSGLPWDVVVNRVPEPKTTKNRVHWDVWGEADTLVAAGATWVRPRDAGIGWDVLADPDDNEFCVFSPGA